MAFSVELQGINRSKEEAERADIVLLVVDSSQQGSDELKKQYQELYISYKDKCIVVLSKTDNKKHDGAWLTKNALGVSAQKNQGLQKLQEAITQKIQTLFKNLRSPFLLNQRHYNLLFDMDKKIQKLIEISPFSLGYELFSYHLKDIIEQCGQLTGRSVNEKMMDAVFRDFCIGK